MLHGHAVYRSLRLDVEQGCRATGAQTVLRACGLGLLEGVQLAPRKAAAWRAGLLMHREGHRSHTCSA